MLYDNFEPLTSCDSISWYPQWRLGLASVPPASSSVALVQAILVATQQVTARPKMDLATELS